MRNQLKRLLTTIRVGHRTRLAGPFIGACVLVALLATNVAADTTPTTYYACANMKNGSIYMVNAGDTCQKGYTPISWNQVGPQGPQGPAGPTQTLSVQTESFPPQIVLSGGSASIIAHCPAGTIASGGGFDVTPSSAQSTWAIKRSAGIEDSGSTGWIVIVNNTGPDAIDITVYASCLTLS
ncbi:MAG TPA: hypothetical protein VH590_02620 [Ktedonobacterales bacterium]